MIKNTLHTKASQRTSVSPPLFAQNARHRTVVTLASCN